ncbi:ribosome-associated translation inhibitor RaiA [Sneathiella sp. P13V-1]|uniref:ribosome hibernation-promoting factor, HPF/YfiA family n=1 Tax=Sneathiella sp. P13V-1 TaxID=2697366 RepID=UPI00187B59EE|nr:ribosome-associated translation inhibitor RaiA [Sneathiella sp. P13V-1]MBE7636128.1 ribosome-associated translation inhibitor RaiA [Sneathiella sp. P13V-1]
MHVIVKGKQVDVGAALTEYIEATLEAHVSKYFDNAIDATVTLSRPTHDFHIECNVHLGSGITVAASANHADAHSCFDSACERIDKQLRRYKRRLKDHHSKERAKAKEQIAAQAYVLAPEPDEEPEDHAANGEWQPMIIAETSQDIPDCSVGEAVMRMDLANVPAMMFHNSGTKGLNVVYRRPDGNIGWIDPKLEQGS